MTQRIVVVDASAGAKWFMDEAGTDRMHALLREHQAGNVLIAVSDLFVYEVLRTVRRRFGTREGLAAASALREAEILTMQPSADVVDAAFAQADALPCDLYDAFSAGLASLLDAPLYSADARAHAAFANVVLVGE